MLLHYYQIINNKDNLAGLVTYAKEQHRKPIPCQHLSDFAGDIIPEIFTSEKWLDFGKLFTTDYSRAENKLEELLALNKDNIILQALVEYPQYKPLVYLIPSLIYSRNIVKVMRDYNQERTNKFIDWLSKINATVPYLYHHRYDRGVRGNTIKGNYRHYTISFSDDDTNRSERFWSALIKKNNHYQLLWDHFILYKNGNYNNDYMLDGTMLTTLPEEGDLSRLGELLDEKIEAYIKAPTQSLLGLILFLYYLCSLYCPVYDLEDEYYIDFNSWYRETKYYSIIDKPIIEEVSRWLKEYHNLDTDTSYRKVPTILFSNNVTENKIANALYHSIILDGMKENRKETIEKIREYVNNAYYKAVFGECKNDKILETYPTLHDYIKGNIEGYSSYFVFELTPIHQSNLVPSIDKVLDYFTKHANKVNELFSTLRI